MRERGFRPIELWVQADLVKLRQHQSDAEGNAFLDDALTEISGWDRRGEEMSSWSRSKGDYGKPGPALIVQSDELNAELSSIVVCPLTSTSSYTTYVRVAVPATPETGLDRRSEVMIDKLAGVPRERLKEVIGKVGSSTMIEVERGLLVLLGFARSSEPVS